MAQGHSILFEYWGGLIQPAPYLTKKNCVKYFLIFWKDHNEFRKVKPSRPFSSFWELDIREQTTNYSNPKILWFYNFPSHDSDHISCQKNVVKNTFRIVAVRGAKKIHSKKNFIPDIIEVLLNMILFLSMTKLLIIVLCALSGWNYITIFYYS